MRASLLDTVTAILAPALTFLLARYLGPDDYGKYGFVLIQISIFKIFTDSLIIKVHQRYEDDNLLLSLLALMIIVLAVPISLFHNLGSSSLLFLFISLSVFNSMIYSHYINSQSRIRATSIKFLKVVMPVLSLYILKDHISNSVIILAFAVPLILNILINISASKSLINVIFLNLRRIKFTEIRRSRDLRFLMIYSLELLLVWLVGFGDQFFLGLSNDLLALGEYRMANSLIFLPFAVLFSPLVSFLFRELVVRAGSFIEDIQFYLSATVLLSLFVGLISFILIQLIIHMDLINSDWNLLKYSLWIAAYLYNGWAIYPIKEYLYAADKERSAFIFSLSEGILYTLLLFLIPHVPFINYLIAKVILACFTSSAQYILLYKVGVLNKQVMTLMLGRFIAGLVVLFSCIYNGIVCTSIMSIFVAIILIIFLLKNYDKYNYSDV